jgi:DNA-binding HxlR family transcriptional regulator
MLVLWDLLNGIHRFDDLATHLGIARAVLARRLCALVDAGLVERVPYRTPGSRVRYEYRLTAAGHDLDIVLTALRDWGDAHLAGPEGSRAQAAHSGCVPPVRVQPGSAAGRRVESRVASPSTSVGPS